MMETYFAKNMKVVKLLRILLIFSSTMSINAETRKIVAVLLNHSAIMPCQLQCNVSSGQSWRFIAVGEAIDEMIYAHSKVQDNFTSLIRTTRNEFGCYDLVLLIASPNFAGTYDCLAAGEHYGLKLFILESHPECGISQRTETAPVFLNGRYDVILSCKVRHWGQWDSESPRMQWNISNGMEISSNLTNVESYGFINMMESSIILTATSEFLTQSPITVTFTIVYFAFNASAEEVQEQRNYSEFEFLWTSPAIFQGFPTHNPSSSYSPEDHRKLDTGTITLFLVVIVIVFLIVLLSVLIVKNSKGERSWKSRFNNEISTRRAARPVYKNDNVSRNQLNPSPNHRAKPWLGQSRNRVPCLETADLPIVAYAESRTNESSTIRSYDSSTIEPVNRIETEDFSIPAYAESRTNESLTSGTYNSSMNEPVNRIETEDFSIPAYAESRTNESLSSGTYNSWINEPVNRIDTVGGTEKQPSVNSAMPVYAEVFKPSLRRNHHDSAPDSSDITPYGESLKAENTLSVKHQNTEVIGELDGTVYTGVSRTNKEVGDSRAPKVPKENPFYAKVDHTQQIPPPMSTT